MYTASISTKNAQVYLLFLTEHNKSTCTELRFLIEHVQVYLPFLTEHNNKSTCIQLRFVTENVQNFHVHSFNFLQKTYKLPSFLTEPNKSTCTASISNCYVYYVYIYTLSISSLNTSLHVLSVYSVYAMSAWN